MGMQGTKSSPPSAVETAVKRLMKGGLTRYEALDTILKNTNLALGLLTAAGIGGIGYFTSVASAARLQLAAEDGRLQRQAGAQDG